MKKFYSFFSDRLIGKQNYPSCDF